MVPVLQEAEVKTTMRLWTRWAALLALTATLAACGAAVTPEPAAAPAQTPTPTTEPFGSCDDSAIRLLDRGAGIHGAIVADPGTMGAATEVYALVNFGFTRSDRLTGWERDNANDITRSEVREADSDIGPGSMAVIDNGVVLIANAVPKSESKIWAFKDGERLEGWDISQVNAAQGMTYDALNKKLYVLPSSAGGIDVYQISINSGTNTLHVDRTESRKNVVSATALMNAYVRDAYGRHDKWHRWGIALLGDYLYVGYHDGKIRCFNKDTGAHVKAKDLENIDVKYVKGLTAVGSYLAFGGPTEDGITLWDVAAKKPVPELVITASELKTVNEYFDISAIAYNGTDQRLYVMDHGSDYVVAFAASNRAYPNSEHRFRTMDRARLRAEAREEHVKDLSLHDTKLATLTVSKVAESGASNSEDLDLSVGVIAVDELPPPGTAGRRVWVKADYRADRVSVQPHSFDGTDMANSDYGSRGYWRSPHGWAVGSLLGDFPALHMISESELALLTGPATPTKLHVGGIEYPLAGRLDRKNKPLLGGGKDPTQVDIYTIGKGGLPTGAWNDLWIEGTARAPAEFYVKQGEYVDTGSAWSPAGFEAPLGNPARDFDLLIRERIPGAAQTVTQVLRTLNRGALQGVVRGWVAPWAQAGSSAGIPWDRLPFEKLTQAEYDAKAAANTIDANTLYMVVG